ncbi:MAG: M28 family peptidase [Gemmatimonadaceae bacterium]
MNGAADPVGAAAALIEAARGLGTLLKGGWRPQRTIILALWDGEEWGLLGSTEWAEAHAAELDQKAVAYLNTDMYTKGVFDADGSATLRTFVEQVARDVKDPATGQSLLDRTRATALARAKNGQDSATLARRGFELSPPGSGTDFEAFLEHLGIATVSHEFGSGLHAGTYHSIYDSFENFTRYLDPGFHYGAAQARVVGTMAFVWATRPSCLSRSRMRRTPTCTPRAQFPVPRRDWAPSVWTLARCSRPSITWSEPARATTPLTAP